jgi:hypothetical protein
VSFDVPFILSHSNRLHSFQVFSDPQEKLLVKYLKRSSDIFFGLTAKDTIKLAYDFATKLQLKCPQNWTKNFTAGKDWLAGWLAFKTESSTVHQKATSYIYPSAELQVSIVIT